MRSDRERLLDIEEAIVNIERYAVRGKPAFIENELIQTWILFQFQVIGEAARSLSEEARVTYAQVVWQDIIGFRNLLVHEYFRVDLDLVWTIVEQELPIFKQQVAEILGVRYGAD
jgi:uncharacterized protein with HEPN domain